MLKLNASFSKKVPAELDYSSQSYHASVEVELPDGLTDHQLRERIHNTFVMVRDSVETELNEISGSSVAAQPPAQIEYASNKQVKYLLDMARQNKFSIHDLLGRYNVRDAQQLTRQQCSQLIYVVNGKAA
jgi:hypothetical protein